MALILAILLVAAPDGGVAPRADLPLTSCRGGEGCAAVGERCLRGDGGTSGECVCADGWCAKRGGAADAGVACASHEACAVDWSAGLCVAAAEGGYRFPLRGEGPTCACRAGQCAFEWQAPVKCQTWRDCSLAREPVWHPVSSKEIKREHARPVRPCKDAEHDSVCDEKTKTCRMVAWSC